nr:sulfotransferase [Mycobacterium lepraemurium]
MLAEAIEQAGLPGADLDDTHGFVDRLHVHAAAIEADHGLRQLTRGVAAATRGTAAAQPVVADRAAPAVSRDRVHPDRAAVHRRRDAAFGHHASGEPDRLRPAPARTALLGEPGSRSRPVVRAPTSSVSTPGARAKAEHEALMASAPVVAAMHDRFPEAIEEEVELLDLDLTSYVLEWHARVPDWRDHYLSLDQTRHYAYLEKVLQALTFLRGPRTWVLKSPQHCEQVGPLMATFPDATVAFTHRDPVAVIQSAITMMAYSDRLRRTSIDPQWLLDYWSARAHLAADRALHAIHLAQLLPAEHPGAREVLRQAHEKLLASSTNFWESAWLRHQVARNS